MRISRPRTRWLLAAGTLLTGGLAVMAVAAPNPPAIQSGPGVNGVSIYTKDPSPTFTFLSGGNGSGIFDWSVSGATDRSGTSTGSATAIALSDGTHSFRVQERPSPDDPDQSPSGPAGVEVFVVDTDAPSAAKPAANGDTSPGWFNAGQVPVTITSSCEEGGSPVSGPEFDGPGSITGNFNNTIRARCEDAAGNVGSFSAATLVRVDVNAPTITRSVNPPTPDGAAGWYRGAVTVDTDCTETGGSGLVGSCPGDVSAGQGVTVVPAASVSDVAGNTSGTVPAVEIRRDSIAPPNPVITSSIPAQVQLGVTPPTTFAFTCPTDGGSPIPPGCVGANVPQGALLDFGTPGQGTTATLGQRTLQVVSRDEAGNESGVTRTYTVVDTLNPTQAVPGGPADVTNQVRPQFTWQAATDAGTGVVRYDVRVDSTTFQVPVPVGTTGEVSFTIPANAAPLSRGQHDWRVIARDARGLSSTSITRTFTVDPSAPDPPAITGGPRGFTRSTSPAFTFSGLPGALFTWSLESGTSDETLQSAGPTAAGTASLVNLVDGQYRFKVRQTNTAGSSSGSAVVVFTVDTVAPAAPTVTTRPGTTGDGQPSFGWTNGEPGATFQWRVTSPAGAAVLGPSSVAATSVRIPSPLPGGAYLFEVRQIDPAGNESGWSPAVPFTVVGAPAVVPPSTARPGTVTRIVPKTRNAKRLKPRVGLVVRTLRPTLSWTRVRNASLYNVQVYRINGNRAVKVLSVFPRGNRYVVPKGKLKAGQRYQWRVWPYFAKLKRYSRTEHGVSWFDVSRLAGVRCSPNYTGACVPVRARVTCAVVGKRNFRVARGKRDVYRLDRDRDRIACERGE